MSIYIVVVARVRYKEWRDGAAAGGRAGVGKQAEASQADWQGHLTQARLRYAE